MEPLNKGHIGTRSFVLYKEVSFIRRLKCIGIIEIGTSRFVLYREVSFIRGVLYRRFHCIPSATGHTIPGGGHSSHREEGRGCKRGTAESIRSHQSGAAEEDLCGVCI